MDILEHLTQEHREAERLMAKLKASEAGEARNALVEQLTQALKRHMAVEERFVYPIVGEAEGEEPVEEAGNEHELIREALGNLEDLRDEPGFGAAAEGLEATVGHHVEEEEGEVFPQLRQKAAAKVAELDPAACEAAVEGIDLTRDELYEKARDAGVEGRSSMTKDELAQAIADAM